ncbi:MAG: ROK family protein [Hyphomicrobiales bacterium]|nr:ROK family protein [Hyphomicrobiales bacterium]
MSDTSTLPTLAEHGARRLPAVEVDSYNVELKDDEGFIGDRASRRAFRQIIDNWRTALAKMGRDPLGDESSDALSKKALDELLARGDPEAAGIVQGAVEEFAQEFAVIIRRFLKLKDWKGTERLLVGGGFRASRIGELVVGRTAVILKADGVNIELVPIRNDPDEAGLLGAVHLAPAWMFKAFDAVLGVDIGGTNIRAGVVELNLKRDADLSKTKVWKFSLWRHGDQNGVKRDHAVETLADMLQGLITAARKELKLAPFVGIGCLGLINADGSIARGAQNLPGNWESSKFNLPASLHALIPTIGDHETSIVMHNDAVVQGLSEVPRQRDVTHWGVFTIGTGLGNARFTNRNGGA